MNPFRSLMLALSRMPPLLMFFIIIGLAIVGTIAVTSKLSEGEQQAALLKQQMDAKNQEKVKVVYATKNIDEGQIIPTEALEERDVEASKAPVDAFQSVNAVVGQIAAFPIPQGTIVSNHAVKPVAVQTGFEGKIKDGMRAITFSVDATSGVAGFIAPGSHVDVIAFTGQEDKVKAAPVMSDVEVIAVGTTYQKTPGGQTTANPAGSVTVLVTPDDAVKLIEDSKAAGLYLTLRSDKDHTPIAIVDVKSLFPKKGEDKLAAVPPPGALPPPPLPGAPDGAGAGGPEAAPPPPPMHDIEVWSGSKKETLSVPQG